MDGIKKAELQRVKGTREIVEELDRLRLTLGFDKVEVLTPIVETRLRSGLLPPKALKVGVMINRSDSLEGSKTRIRMEITIQIGYPELSPTVEFFDSTTINGDEDEDGDGENTLINKLYKSANIWLHCAEPLRPVELIQHCFAIVNSEAPCECTDSPADVSTVQTEININTEENDLNKNETLVEIYDTRTFFCCKICSSVLFDGSHLHAHSQHGSGEHKCTSFFLEEAPAWLPTSGSDAEKIYCTKCKTRVGGWSWVGSTCSCDTWIVPSFQFTMSKLDVKFI